MLSTTFVYYTFYVEPNAYKGMSVTKTSLKSIKEDVVLQVHNIIKNKKMINKCTKYANYFSWFFLVEREIF